MVNNIYFDNNKFVFVFKYNPLIIKAIKDNFVSYRFNGEKRIWTVGLSEKDKLPDFANKYGFNIKFKWEKLPTKVGSMHKITIKDDDIFIEFPFDTRIIYEIKNTIKQREFLEEERMWRTGIENISDVASFVDNCKEFYKVSFSTDGNENFKKLVESIISEREKKIDEESKKKTEQLRKRLKTINKYLENYDFPVKPFEHQKECVSIVLANKSFGVFDEQGVGKTYESLIIADILVNKTKAAKKCLIIPLASLKYNWLSEIKNLYPKTKVNLFDTSATKKDIIKNNNVIIKNINKINCDFLIIHYEAVKKHRDKIFEWMGDECLVILDECHKIKNPNAEITKTFIGKTVNEKDEKIGKNKKVFIKGLADKAKYKIPMSGTPIANKPEDSYTVLKILGAEEVKCGYTKFIRRFMRFSEYGTEYVNLNQLRDIVRKYSIRRLKEDCLDLPDKIFQNYFVELEDEQRRIYNKAKYDLALELFKDGEMIEISTEVLIVKMLRLAQISSNPSLIDDNYDYKKAGKYNELREIVNNIIENNRKVVIYSNYRKTIDLMLDMFKEHNPLCIHGGTKVSIRQENVDKFQNDENHKVFCLTSAGGLGITLTRADTLIFVDRDFSVTKYKQTSDRIHRIGQTNNCSIIKMIGRNTIDEYIDKKLEQKMGITDYISGDIDEINKIVITKDEVKEVLGLE